jgi:hypothetical protein
MEQENIAAIHTNAVRKNFWDTIQMLDSQRGAGVIDQETYRSRAFEFYAKQCMMLVSELMEALRKDKGQHEVESESADIFIRLADLYEGLRTHGLVDKTLNEAISEKVVINGARPAKHGVLG